MRLGLICGVGRIPGSADLGVGPGIEDTGWKGVGRTVEDGLAQKPELGGRGLGPPLLGLDSGASFSSNILANDTAHSNVLGSWAITSR